MWGSSRGVCENQEGAEPFLWHQHPTSHSNLWELGVALKGVPICGTDGFQLCSGP